MWDHRVTSKYKMSTEIPELNNKYNTVLIQVPNRLQTTTDVVEM